MTQQGGRIQAVSLDIWGTILRSDPDFKPSRNALLRDALAPAVDEAVFNEVMRTADRAADDESMRTGMDVGFTERVVLTLQHLGMPAPADLAERVPALLAQQAVLAREHHPQPLHPDLPRAIAELAAVMPVAYTSNTGMLPGSLMRELLALAHFDSGLGEVFSNETGVAKPAAGIFDVTVRAIEALADARGFARPGRGEILHVGDNPIADLHGAQSAGLQAVLVSPNGGDTLAVLEELLSGRLV